MKFVKTGCLAASPRSVIRPAFARITFSASAKWIHAINERKKWVRARRRGEPHPKILFFNTHKWRRT
jgi:hypothetical protein